MILYLLVAKAATENGKCAQIYLQWLDLQMWTGVSDVKYGVQQWTLPSFSESLRVGNPGAWEMVKSVVKIIWSWIWNPYMGYEDLGWILEHLDCAEEPLLVGLVVWAGWRLPSPPFLTVLPQVAWSDLHDWSLVHLLLRPILQRWYWKSDEVHFKYGN